HRLNRMDRIPPGFWNWSVREKRNFLQDEWRGELLKQKCSFVCYATLAIIGAYYGGFNDEFNAGSVELPEEVVEAQRDNTIFRSFTKNNFRTNLIRLTGEEPAGYEAHHVLPQKYRELFDDTAGINIDDPRYGSWVEQGSHSRWSSRYN